MPRPASRRSDVDAAMKAVAAAGGHDHVRRAEGTGKVERPLCQDAWPDSQQLPCVVLSHPGFGVLQEQLEQLEPNWRQCHLAGRPVGAVTRTVDREIAGCRSDG